MNSRIYLDAAATTAISGEVLNEMMPAFTINFGNSNSIHSFGRDAEKIVDLARDRIAKAINAQKSNEIYFTSGGTEANNWAIKGIAYANKSKGNHIITSAIEHESILRPLKDLEKEGFKVTYLPCDKNGIVPLEDLLHNLRRETILISIMSVNNEIGTIQNIKAIGKTAHEHNIIFHTDAVQAIGNLKMDVQDMEIDVMTFNAHKIYGPKGIGALYVKNGIEFEPLIKGGSQERSKRGGTLNVPSIAGFGKAVELAVRDYFVNTQKLKQMKNLFINELNKRIPDIKINGHPQQVSPSIVNISFKNIDAEALLTLLDMEGIAVSTGAACTAHSVEKSHVLTALGLSNEEIQSSIRFSFPKSITKEEILFVVEKTDEFVKKLREISPLTTGRKKWCITKKFCLFLKIWKTPKKLKMQMVLEKFLVIPISLKYIWELTKKAKLKMPVLRLLEAWLLWFIHQLQ